MKRIAFWLALALFTLPLAAQSLTELAEKGKEERDKNKPAKVYTNADLKSAKGNIATSTVPQPKKEETEGSKELTEAEKAEKQKKEHPEEYYRDQIIAKKREIGYLKIQLASDNVNQVNARDAYMSNSSGPVQNSQLKPAWDKAVATYEETSKKLKQAQADLATLKEAARKAGVLPGVIDKAEREGENLPLLDEEQTKQPRS